MPTYLPVLNTTNGLDQVLRTVQEEVSLFIPMLLIFIYVVIFITGYKKQKEESGNGDMAQWAVVSGIVTSIVALILSMGTNIISLQVLVITIAITILSAIWFISSGDKGG